MKIKVIANYETNEKVSKEEAESMALHHFHAELSRWADGREMARAMWEFEVEE